MSQHGCHCVKAGVQPMLMVKLHETEGVKYPRGLEMDIGVPDSTGGRTLCAGARVHPLICSQCPGSPPRVDGDTRSSELGALFHCKIFFSHER